MSKITNIKVNDKDINSIVKNITEFYNEEIIKKPNGRFKSWEHCYYAFYKAHEKHIDLTKDEFYLDHLCLHLACFLATFGMYRNSFLLQTDYKIHKKIILEIFKEEYNELWSIEVNQYKEEKFKKMLKKLAIMISNLYEEIRKEVEEKETPISITLITKVLMGTMGCVPAYDRNFKKGLKKYNILGELSKIEKISDSVEVLAKFYDEHFENLENIRKEMNIDKLEYPPMKLIDMYFWKVGYKG